MIKFKYSREGEDLYGGHSPGAISGLFNLHHGVRDWREEWADELIAAANTWLTNEAEFNRQAEVIAAFVKATRAIQADRTRRRAITTNQWQESLFAALALAEPEPEAEAAPLTITVPPDTAGELIAPLTKVAKLLEQKGGK